MATYTRKDYPGYNKHLARMFATVGRKPRLGSEHDSGSSLIAAVAAGHEFALLPSCASGTAGDRLRFLKVRPSLPPWSIVALWRKDAGTEAVRAFVAAALPDRAESGRAVRRDSAKRQGNAAQIPGSPTGFAEVALDV